MFWYICPIQDYSLEICTTRYRFIRNNGFARLFPIKEICTKSLSIWDRSRSSNKYYLVHISFSNLGILENILHWIHTLREMVHGYISKPDTCTCAIKINPFKKRVNLDESLHIWGYTTLCTIIGSMMENIVTVVDDVNIIVILIAVTTVSNRIFQ